MADEFAYIFGEKDELLIVLLQGKIMSKDIATLEKCASEISEKSQKIVLFSFRDVPTFIPGAHSAFAKIQKQIRDAGKLMASCSMRPEIKIILLQSGIVRDAEMFNNIPEAWQKLKAKLESNPPKAKPVKE